MACPGKRDTEARDPKTELYTVLNSDSNPVRMLLDFPCYHAGREKELDIQVSSDKEPPQEALKLFKKYSDKLLIRFMDGNKEVFCKFQKKKQLVKDVQRFDYLRMSEFEMDAEHRSGYYASVLFKPTNPMFPQVNVHPVIRVLKRLPPTSDDATEEQVLFDSSSFPFKTALGYVGSKKQELFVIFDAVPENVRSAFQTKYLCKFI